MKENIKTIKIIMIMVSIISIETFSLVYKNKIVDYIFNQNKVIAISKKEKTKTILVGDSRTVGICKGSYDNYYSGKCIDYLGVYQNGANYNWLLEKGIKGVNKILKNDKKSKYNIVILLGVNDLRKGKDVDFVARKYMMTINNLAKKSWKNHNIIFASVTKVEGKETIERFSIPQSNINKFNNKVKLQILSSLNNIKYCDINSDINLDGKIKNDRLHYTYEGYEEVYNQIKEKCL